MPIQFIPLPFRPQKIDINLLRLFWKYYLKWNRWTIEGKYPHEVPKLVLAIAPHTSAWDFILGLAVRSRLRLHHVRFLGKQELFRPPFGFIFRWVGGTPVNRRSSNNVVTQVVEQFNASTRFSLALSPEGTRKRVDKLRTGFYQVALQAHVPILPVAFDFGSRRVIFGELFYPTGNEENDFAELLRFWAPARGRIPEKGLMHLAPDS